jgi:uridine monophosphate synthetase
VTAFFDRVRARSLAINSLLCVGIDPIVQSAAELFPYAERLIEATAPLAAAFKPNAAYFERYGAAGVAALERTIRAIPANIPIILDGKRGDIGTSNEAYRDAAFMALGADALTANPYLGLDALEQLRSATTRGGDATGLLVLCRTSNPDAASLQRLRLQTGETVFEWIATEVAARWSARDVGLVVGATDVDAIARLRARVAQHWFLMPGIGKQGGDLAPAVASALTVDGSGVLVSVSSAIANAADPRGAANAFVDAIRTEVMRKSHVRNRAAGAVQSSFEIAHPELARNLLKFGIVKFGQFTLKSGVESPVYLDFRRIVAYPALLAECAAALSGLLANVKCDCIAALPYAGMPLGTATSLHADKPMVYPRKAAKEYGTKAQVEGVFDAGQRAVMLDDLASDGGSKLEALEKLQAVGLIVQDVVVLVDRDGGARRTLAAEGLTLHAVFGFRQLIAFWRAEDRITAEQTAAVIAFLDAQTREN